MTDITNLDELIEELRATETLYRRRLGEKRKAEAASRSARDTLAVAKRIAKAYGIDTDAIDAEGERDE